jgi:hypothetical protein
MSLRLNEPYENKVELLFQSMIGRLSVLRIGKLESMSSKKEKIEV